MKSTSTVKLVQILLHVLSFTFEKGVTLVLSAILLATTPFLLVASIPYLLYRHALNKLGGRIKPSLGAMVRARSSVFAMDPLYNREKPLISIVVHARFQERLELSRLRTLIEERLLPATEKNGNLKFPELRQFLTVWGGFFFWEWDPTFNLDNHIKHHRLKCQSDPEGRNKALNKFNKELLQRPWAKNKPLWEIWIVDLDDVPDPNSNLISDKMEVKTTSALFLRTTHCLGDGYSLLFLVSEYFSESGMPLDRAQPVPAHRPVWRTALFFLTLPFRAAWESCDILAQRINPFTILPFTVPWSSQASAPMHLLFTKALPVDRIKQIKDHFQVSFTSVVNATFAGGLRELMLSKGISKPPSIFPVLIPLPLPGHPGAGLRNYMGAAVAHLPTRVKDPLSRLRACDRDITRLKRSTFPLLSFIGVKMVGCGPAWVLRLFCRNWFCSAWLTSFPVGNTPMDVAGVETKELRFGMGLFTGPTGLGFAAVSYQDEMRITVTGDGFLFTKSDMKLLIKALEGQIDLLYEQMKETL